MKASGLGFVAAAVLLASAAYGAQAPDDRSTAKPIVEPDGTVKLVNPNPVQWQLVSKLQKLVSCEKVIVGYRRVQVGEELVLIRNESQVVAWEQSLVCVHSWDLGTHQELQWRPVCQTVPVYQACPVYRSEPIYEEREVIRWRTVQVWEPVEEIRSGPTPHVCY